MTSMRLPLAWRTLRFRLAAWNAAIIVLTAIVTLIGVRQGVRRALISELDQMLADDLREVQSIIHDAANASHKLIQDYLTRTALSHEHHGWYVKLFDANGAQAWATPDAQPGRPSPTLNYRPRPLNFRGYRILDAPVHRPSGNFHYVRMGASLDSVARDLARIDRLVLFAVGAVLVIAPPCGYWLAARATHPVGDIIRTAARLRPSHLDERLSVRGTGDELDQMAQTINMLLDRIATYIDTKRDFLANAAHELRTPLAAIRSSVEVAMDGKCSAEQYEELLVDITEECSALETLVNQLLLLVETESHLPAARFEPVDFRELTLKAIDMFTGFAESRGLEINASLAPAPVMVNGNRQHLRQLLNNLLDNAVKYTPTRGTIEVALSLEHEQEIILRLYNSGPGISREEQQHIFERFFRAESARTRCPGAGGSGLGLSICQSIVQNHAGRIECVSEPDSGAVFIVRLQQWRP